MAPYTVESADEPQGFAWDEDFCFEDANVIIVAQTYTPSTRPIAFRIHRGVLYRHSDIIRQLLSIPQSQPNGCDDTLNGCPVVSIPDTAHNFKLFLRALYDGVMYPGIEKMDFGTAAAFVRLGHKYEVPSITNAGLKRLETVFASRSIWTSRTLSCDSPLLTWVPEDAIEAANLFRTVGRHDLRLIALYACTNLDNAILIRGVLRADGFRETLEDDDLERCLNARDRFVAQRVDLISKTNSTLWRDCTSPPQCDHRLNRAVPAFVVDEQAPSWSKSTRGGLEPVFPDWESDNQLCSSCRRVLHGREVEFQTALWRSLPEIMGLEMEGWDDLDV